MSKIVLTYYMNGPSVTYAERLKITFYCPFEFEDFPFDSHHCGLTFGLSNSDINSFKLMPTNLTYEQFSTLSTKGQLISKGLSGVIVWTKKQTKGFLS